MFLMTRGRIAIVGVFCILLTSACDELLTTPTPVEPNPVVGPPDWLRPVRLDIPNFQQETPVWCWAAAAQQIIWYYQLGTPPQCELVAYANRTDPYLCCSGPHACPWVGTLVQIQELIRYYGGRYSSISPPANPVDVYNTLALGRPIIMAVKATGAVGHVIVISGMEWRPTPFGGEPVLLINDPLSYFTQPISFARIAQYWQAAIVVY